MVRLRLRSFRARNIGFHCCWNHGFVRQSRQSGVASLGIINQYKRVY